MALFSIVVFTYKPVYLWLCIFVTFLSTFSNHSSVYLNKCVCKVFHVCLNHFT